MLVTNNIFDEIKRNLGKRKDADVIFIKSLQDLRKYTGLS